MIWLENIAVMIALAGIITVMIFLVVMIAWALATLALKRGARAFQIAAFAVFMLGFSAVVMEFFDLWAT